MTLISTIEAICKRYYLSGIDYQLAVSTPFLAMITSKGRVKPAEGKELVKTLEYGDTTGGPFGSTTVFDTTDPESHTEAVFDWAFNYANISFNTVDLTLNKGAHAVVNLVKSKTNQAKRKLKSVINLQIWGTGSSAGPPQEIERLENVVDNDNTYGGIDRSTYAWWAAGNLAVGASIPLSVSLIRKTVRSVGDEGIRPNLCVTTEESFQKVWDELYGKAQNINYDKELLQVSMDGIKIGDTTLISDRNCPTSNAYYITTDHLELYPNKNLNMKMGEIQKVVDMPKYVGQLTDCRQIGTGLSMVHHRQTNLDET